MSAPFNHSNKNKNKTTTKQQKNPTLCDEFCLVRYKGCILNKTEMHPPLKGHTVREFLQLELPNKMASP